MDNTKIKPDYKELWQYEKRRANKYQQEIREMEQVLQQVAALSAPYVIKNR